MTFRIYLCEAATSRASARIATLFALIVTMSTASAINGYFLPGYGPKSLGVAGTGVAMPQDRLAASNNPAGMALVAPGFDASATLLHPQRSALLDCTGIGQCDQAVRDRSKREFFVIPGFGYSRRWGERTTLGVSTYANGGLNTSYSRDLYRETALRIAGQRPGDPGFPTHGKIGIDFAQFIIAPSVAYRASERWTLGIAPILVIQKFSSRGLESFAALSADSTSLTGRDSDYELGGGVRVGAIYQLRPDVRLGAQYSSELFIHRYTKYNGLFADNGSFNGPSHFAVGFAWDVSPKLTVGFDFQRILFAEIGTIGNPGPTLAELTGNIAPARRLGGAEGIGFGWNNQSVYKIGAIYQYSDKLTLRAGWDHGSEVAPSSAALLAPLAPGSMRDDFTTGLSYRLPGGQEISIAYLHGFGATTQNRKTNFFGVPVKAWAAADALSIGLGRDF